jgi:hypothetical protein
MNMRDARKRWRQLGGTVDNRRGTGEDVYRHPALRKPITVNGRRKDAPRVLTRAIRRLLGWGMAA